MVFLLLMIDCMCHACTLVFMWQYPCTVSLGYMYVCIIPQGTNGTLTGSLCGVCAVSPGCIPLGCVVFVVDCIPLGCIVC